MAKSAKPKSTPRKTAALAKTDGSLRFYGLLLAAIIAAVYLNSLTNAFVYDDRFAIVENRSIESFTTALRPPVESPVAGRPVANLSFAVSYAIGGRNPAVFRIGNILIHIAAALLLFGIIRRTLNKARSTGAFGGDAALPLAFTIAALWAVHPLQSEVIDYVTQRTESLAGALLLLTLYAGIRSAQTSSPAMWETVSLLACALGMATKETMATAPFVVILYDRVFLASSFRELLKRRWRLYAGLLATLLIAGALAAGHPRAGSIGGSSNLTLYLRNQCWALARYFRLLVWPIGQVMDYGPPHPLDTPQIVPGILLVAALIVAAIVGLVLAPPAGFLAAWFVLLLLPSSSIIPIMTEAAAERRVYLASAAPIALVVLTIYWFASRLRGPRAATAKRAAVALAALSMALLSYQTMRRNREYRTERIAWQTVVDRFPHARAFAKLAVLADQDGDVRTAAALYQKAIAANPADSNSHWNLAHLFQEMSQPADALREYRVYVALEPDNAIAHAALGEALLTADVIPEGVAELKKAAELDPTIAEVHGALGIVALHAESYAEAAGEFEKLIALDPNDADAFQNLGLARLGDRKVDDAIAAFQRALALRPGWEEAKQSLTAALEFKRLAEERTLNKKGR